MKVIRCKTCGRVKGIHWKSMAEMCSDEGIKFRTREYDKMAKCFCKELGDKKE